MQTPQRPLRRLYFRALRRTSAAQSRPRAAARGVRARLSKIVPPSVFARLPSKWIMPSALAPQPAYPPSSPHRPSAACANWRTSGRCRGLQKGGTALDDEFFKEMDVLRPDRAGPIKVAFDSDPGEVRSKHFPPAEAAEPAVGSPWLQIGPPNVMLASLLDDGLHGARSVGSRVVKRAVARNASTFGRVLEFGVQASASHMSLSDPASRWTAAQAGPASFAYCTNYLIHLDHAVIVDGEPPPP